MSDQPGGDSADFNAVEHGFWHMSLDLLATADGSGYLTRLSPSWERTLGFTPAELTAHPYLHFVHPDDVAATLEATSGLRGPAGRAVNFENRYATKDGGWRWLSWNTQMGDDGKTIFCIARDVTPAHDATEQFLELITRLEDRELMLSGVIQNSHGLIYVKGLDGRYLVYNQPFADAFDLDTRAAAEGTTGLRVLLGRTDTWLDADLAPVWRGNDERAAVCRYEVEEWSDHPVLGRLTYDSVKFPLADAAGTVYATCGVSTETTERVRLVERHRAAEDLFRGAFEHSPIGKALIGPNRQIMRGNPALARITGYTTDQLIGRTLQDLAVADHVPDKAQLRRLAAGEIAVYERELQLLTATGNPLWAQMSSSTVRDPDGELVYVIAQIQDISQRKRLEERLRHVADHDALTGLRNRRIFDEDLTSQIGRSQRYGEEAALLMIDLDGFKQVNDRHGHRSGDDVLRAVAAALRERLRTSDLIARIGGDEFAVLLPHVTPEQAKAVASAVRDCIAAATAPTSTDPVGVTASVGVALIDEHTTQAETVLAAADANMYAAKNLRQTSDSQRPAAELVADAETRQVTSAVR